MGCGIASGENRAIEAAQKAISSPLLEGINIKGAKSVLLNVTGSSNLTIQEINDGNNIIFEAAGEETNVIFGCVRKEDMNDYVSYTVIATGFNGIHGNLSSKASTQKKKSYSDGDYSSGFNFMDNDIDQQNLEIPTILRVKSPKVILDSKKDDVPESGFKFDPPKHQSQEDKKENKEKEESEDSSSFLRMIMD